MTKRIFFFIGFFLTFFFCAKPVWAGTLTSVKDVISTSRPSGLTYLAGGVTANVTTQIIVSDNGSRWVASDSATLLGGTAESVTIASMSAANIPAASQRTLYLTGKALQSHNIGTSVFTSATAKHTVSFTTVNSIPDTGKIQIIFPAGNVAGTTEPSPNGFSFNNLSGATGSQTNIQISGGSLACSSWTVTASTGLVQCNLSTGATGPTAASITIGSSTPTLINPSKTAAAGTADTWTVQVKTTDSAGLVIDSAKAKVGTVESVEVYATVDPTLTFVISGVNNGTSVSSGNLVGCTKTETINTGFNSSATEVNLGVLGSSVINISSQLLTVTTNGFSGYSLTATASGHLLDPSIGYWIADVAATTANDTPTNGTALVAGTPAYGIQACGADVTGGAGTGWGPANCGTAAGTCLYKMPTSTFYQTLASDSTGPIVGTSGNGLTTVTYGATISTAVPAGDYRTVMTYVATPVF